MLIIVETNSELYGTAKPFIAEVDLLADNVLKELLSHLKQLSDQRQTKARAKLSLDIFWEIVNWGDISVMTNYALDLWEVSKKGLDPAVINRSTEPLRKKANVKQEYQPLSSKLMITT